MDTKGVATETSSSCTLTAVGHHLILFGGAIIKESSRGFVSDNLYIFDTGELFIEYQM